MPAQVLAAATDAATQSAASSALSPRAKSARGWSWWFVGVWLGGIAIGLVMWLVSYVRFVRALPAAGPAPHDWTAEWEGILAAEGVRTALPLRITEDVGPCLCRLPRGYEVLVPECLWRDLSVEQRLLILHHELAHFRRGDVWKSLAARLVALVHWFNPLAWISVRYFDECAEWACDRMATRSSLGAAAEFSKALLTIGGAPACAGHYSKALRRGSISVRIRRLLGASTLADSRVKKALLVFVPLMLCMLNVVRFELVAKEPAKSGVPVSVQPKGTKQVAPDKPADAKPDAKQRTMRIQVLGPDGKPLPETAIKVSFWTDDPVQQQRRNRDYTCDEQGQTVIELAQTMEILRIWAKKDGYVELFASWWAKKQPDGHIYPPELTFRMETGHTIGGIITNEKGEPIADTTVEIYPVSRPTNFLRRGPFPQFVAGGVLSKVQTDAEGRWQLERVPSGDDGEVQLKLSHPAYVSDQRFGDLQRSQNISQASLIDGTAKIVMQEGIRTIGVVTDADGNKVPGAVVVWGDDPYWQHIQQEVKTDAKGFYRLPPRPAGPLTVTVIARGWAPAQKKIELSATNAAANFQLERGKTLRIRFKDPSGAPISKVRVEIEGWRGGRALYNKQPFQSIVLESGIPREANAEGMFEWTWAPDDPVEFHFEREGFVLREFLRRVDRKSLQASEQEHVITLQKGN